MDNIFNDDLEVQISSGLDDDRGHIRGLALKYGFKLKRQADGDMDLNDYVYAFAEALRAELLPPRSRNKFGSAGRLILRYIRKLRTRGVSSTKDDFISKLEVPVPVNLWGDQPSLLVPLFKCGRVFLFTDRQALTDATEYLGVESDDLDSVIGVSRQIEGPDGEYAFAVGVFSGGIPTLAHELAHVCFNIMARVGVTVNENNANETYCYMLEVLLTYFLPHLPREH